MNFIHHIPKAYPKKSCNNLINWFEENIELASPGTSGEKFTTLDDLEIPLTVNNKEDYFNLGKTLEESIKNFKETFPYVDKYICRWELVKNMQLMKYKPNNFYTTIHCENDGNRMYLKRVFAFMIFLNNIKKGGGTKFLHQKFIAKPKAGDFYIWPAHWTHLHKGVNAPKENKYIITGWVEYI